MRERILTRELIQLPTVVQGLSNRVDAISNRLEVISNVVEALTDTLQQFIREQRALNERLEQTLEELKVANGNAVRRMDRVEQDSSYLKNFATTNDARRFVESIADDMDLTYVRTLTTRELMDMAEGHLQGSVRRSFVRADLIMEAIDNGQPCYAAVEVSYTTDSRDTNRAIRNAGYIARFTGRPCHPGIVGVRKDWETTALVDAGTVRWSELEDWQTTAEEGLS